MHQIISEPELKPKTLDTWNWKFKFSSGSTSLLRAIVAYNTKMHLLRETYFLTLALPVPFRTLSKFVALLILDSMDIIVKLFRHFCWIDDLTYEGFN